MATRSDVKRLLALMAIAYNAKRTEQVKRISAELRRIAQ